MDGKWLLPILPTECKADSEPILDKFAELFPAFKPLTSETQPFFIDQVQALTIQLKKHAYCPSTWTSRAYNLLRLGYPDLAIGDAFKAQALANIYLENGPKLQEVSKELWRQAKTIGYFKLGEGYRHEEKASRIENHAHRTSDRSALILAQALFKAHCYIECHEYLIEYQPKLESSKDGLRELAALAERACRIEELGRTQDRDRVKAWDKASLEQKRSGTIIPQIYPWMAPYIEREGLILREAKARVNSSTQRGCHLRTSTIVCSALPTGETGVEDHSKILGVFAKKNFAIGDVVMVDKTALSGVDEQTSRCSCCRGLFSPGHLYYYRTPCCDTPLCSEECKSISMAQYHYPECVKLSDLRNSDMDLFTHYASEDTLAMNDLLYRVLAHLENTPQFYPLRVPTIGAMTVTHHDNGPVLFSVINDIQRPFEMLKDLGIDLFADQAYDTWIIQTIQARIRNNVRIYEDDHGQYHAALNLSFMFFNHGCEPNVDIEIPNTGSSNITVKAIRPIQAGEELFITYIDNDDLKLSYNERQECLQTWMRECRCQRCYLEHIFDLIPLTPAITLDDPNDDDFHINNSDEEEDDEDNDETEVDEPAASRATTSFPLANILSANITRRPRILGDQSMSIFDWTADDELTDSPSEARKRRRIF